MSSHSIKLRSQSSLLALKIKRKISEVPYNDFLTNQTKLEYTDNIQNGLYVTLTHSRIRQLTNIFNILLGLNIFMLFTYIFKKIYVPHHVHFVCSLLLAVLFWVQYDSMNRIIKSDYKYWKTIAKIFSFFLIHPIPWINHETVTVAYDNTGFQNGIVAIKLNYIILLVTLMKCIVIFLTRALINSQYMEPRANRIKKIYSVNVQNIMYTIRCIFQDQPIKMFLCFFIIGTAYFSFSLKVIQSSVPLAYNPFQYYGNALWYMLITTTTVGYGQIRPYTHLGYCFIVMATIFGSLCISGTVFILVNALTLDPKEKAGLTSFNKVRSHLLYKDKCRLYLRVAIWRLWTNYKTNKKVRENLSERRLRARLRQIRIQGKSFNITTNITQLCQRQFDSAFNNIEMLCENNQNLVNFVNSHMFSEELFREYGGRYTHSRAATSSNYIQEQEQDDESEDSFYRLRKNKAYKQSRYADSNKNIKIRVLKEPIPSESQISQYHIPQHFS